MQIVADDKLNVKNEEVVYSAVLKWAKSDYTSRKQEICEVIDILS